MTPHNHNRTLGLIHGLVGFLTLTGLAIAALSEARRHSSEITQWLSWAVYALLLPLLQLLTAWGLFSKKKWGRMLALILSVPDGFVFPLGTLLAVYTWWFLHSEGGEQLYFVRSVSD